MVGSSSTSSSRRRFFLRAAQLVLWLVLVDLVGGWVLSVMFFRQPVGRFHNTTYALEEMSEELVVLGSSRALHHYDTALIADRVDSTAVNRRGILTPLGG